LFGSGFNHLSSEDGLRSSIIRSVIKSQDDFIWIGTLKGLYRFDGYEVTQFSMPDGQPFNYVRTIVEDQSNTVWIATQDDGIFYIEAGLVYSFKQKGEVDLGSFQVIFKANESIYLVFAESIIQISGLNNIKTIKNPITNLIYSAIEVQSDQLMLGTQNHVYILNTLTSKFNEVPINSEQSNRRKHVIHIDSSRRIWLGRSDGLYEYSKDCQCFIDKHDVLHDIEIHTLGSDNHSLWIGTNQMGVYRFDKETNSVKQYTYDKNNQFSISDIAVISVHVSSDDDLLVGTFNNGLNFINLNSLLFGSVPGIDFQVVCLPSYVIYGIYEESETELWVGTNQGMTRLDLNQESCENFKANPNSPFSISGKYVFGFYKKENELLILGSAGIDVLDLSTNTIKVWSNLIPATSTFFVFELSVNVFLIGTDQGLLFFDSESQELKILDSTLGERLPYRFYHVAETPDGIFFSSNQGLYKLIGDGLEYMPIILDDNEEIQDITGLSYDGENGLLIAADRKYFLRVIPENGIEDLSDLINDGDYNVIVLEIIQDEKGLFWMSSDNGIYKLNLENKQVHNFQSTDGLQSNDFLLISSHQGKSGKLYFGGRQGFNGFYPADITVNDTPPNVVLTEVSQLNKTIALGQATLGGFVLDHPINEMSALELGHKDLSIGFEFAALDYADSSRNQYAYRLLGFNDDWSFVGADNRTANYTNLDPGNYTFQVKGSNKDGVWSPEPKELSIKVYPAPWFSPWAYAAYVLIVLSAIWAFIRYKTIASRKRAEQLEVTVAERTQEVVLQKKMVESLLDHKNEVFANVTHEFKTPLALILGPMDEMANEPELAKFSSQLAMVQRNAKRLLLMVGQILKLSQAEQDKEVIRESQAIQPILLMLYESFLPLAKDKGITLNLKNENEVNVYATSECIETVVGNLISNAVKYTNNGGNISIASLLKGDEVCITVSDNGAGIKEQDIGKIFNRFVRLDDNKNIQGTGIGLAVVKEVTEANNGFVSVLSEWGAGSTFSVTFPITQLSVDGELSRAMTDQLVSNVETELLESEIAVSVAHNEHVVTVLIIEDNLDMQKHTGNVLRNRFNCIFADRGELGIAMALKEVPDIIICDVMMPGMDGYQVTRILRHDERTSHIPIILLTALNTKESRIKGWREKIDRYMTKPFDGTELIVQLDSMLSIRKLLQQKTNTVINNRGPLDTLDLSKQDLRFIEKLKDVIARFYSNEYFQKADLADKMAVSDRQLQRKVKALIGVGPLAMLRDYRLTQSKRLLKDGFQVGQVSDDCAFGSVSYFGTCFKNKYGMTPKQYQQLD